MNVHTRIADVRAVRGESSLTPLEKTTINKLEIGSRNICTACLNNTIAHLLLAAQCMTRDNRPASNRAQAARGRSSLERTTLTAYPGGACCSGAWRLGRGHVGLLARLMAMAHTLPRPDDSFLVRPRHWPWRRRRRGQMTRSWCDIATVPGSA